MLKKIIRKNKIYTLFETFLPEDTSQKITAEYYPVKFLSGNKGPIQVLDLGCGAGNSIALFRKLSPNISWYGVDIENSPELKARTGTDGDIKIYDGVNLPYPDNFFDFIYSNQVFEHVRYPDLLLKNVCRVLKPGGYFAGSVSYLEPYHSYSLFNFTPYGLISVVKDAGLHIVEIRPGADAFSLLFRQMMNTPRLFGCFFDSFSPFDLFIKMIGAIFGLGHKEKNFLKTQFAGHICFLAIK